VADDYGALLTRHVAEQLDAIRRERQLSLDQLAHESGMHRTSISLVFRGRRGLTIERASELAKALGVSLADLVAEAERRARSD
jgi:transcriptional regulator with XRE-family HTH domain